MTSTFGLYRPARTPARLSANLGGLFLFQEELCLFSTSVGHRGRLRPASVLRLTSADAEPNCSEFSQRLLETLTEI